VSRDAEKDAGLPYYIITGLCLLIIAFFGGCAGWFAREGDVIQAIGSSLFAAWVGAALLRSGR